MEIIKAKLHQAAVTPIEMMEALRSGEIETHKGGRLVINHQSPLAEVMAGNEAEKPAKTGVPLNFQHLLQVASKSYRISTNPSDYLVVPVPVIITETPNKNCVGFPAAELSRFLPEYGMQSFKTWTGKPTYVEHDNKDCRKARGIILDTAMTPILDYPGFYKIMMLLSFDRTKDAQLYDNILKGVLNSYSMGARVAAYECSYCGNKFQADARFPGCSHIKKRGGRLYAADGKLVYKRASNIVGFECSSVGDPAWRAALSDFIMPLN